MVTNVKYGMQTTVDASFEEAREMVTAALKLEGFGVLTEINVANTLKEKIGVEMSKYVILGACNPGLANQALQAEYTIGLLLPCNVILYEGETEGQTHVAILEPQLMVELTENEALNDLANEAHARLERVVESL